MPENIFQILEKKIQQFCLYGRYYFIKPLFYTFLSTKWLKDSGQPEAWNIFSSRKGVEVVSCCWSAQGLEIRCWNNSATAKYQLLQFPKNTAGGENLAQVKNVSNDVSENNGGALCL